MHGGLREDDHEVDGGEHSVYTFNLLIVSVLCHIA